MSTDAATRPRNTTTERAIAAATTLAPIAVGTGAPFLDGSAALLTAIGYGSTAGFLAANYMMTSLFFGGGR